MDRCMFLQVLRSPSGSVVCHTEREGVQDTYVKIFRLSRGDTQPWVDVSRSYRFCSGREVRVGGCMLSLPQPGLLDPGHPLRPFHPLPRSDIHRKISPTLLIFLYDQPFRHYFLQKVMTESNLVFDQTFGSRCTKV